MQLALALTLSVDASSIFPTDFPNLLLTEQELNLAVSCSAR